MKSTNVYAKTRLRYIALAGAAICGFSLILDSEVAFADRGAGANGTYQICAADLYLRNARGGSAIDRLKQGSHFEVTSHAGETWVYGYSYWTGKHGWVLNGYFC